MKVFPAVLYFINTAVYSVFSVELSSVLLINRNGLKLFVVKITDSASVSVGSSPSGAGVASGVAVGVGDGLGVGSTDAAA